MSLFLNIVEIILALGFMYMYIIIHTYPWTNRKRMLDLTNKINADRDYFDKLNQATLNEIIMLKNQLNELHNFLKKEGITLPSNN